MKILYVFPHPDDESFGPAGAMSKQRRQGHDVHLLTLTRGGATKQRHKYGLSVEEMGAVRYKEMLDVAKVLDLSGMKVLNLPDSGLKEMDPREIEEVIAEEIETLRPDVVVTYAVHGISGFHDHIVTHAAVKRAYAALKDTGAYLKRLAFYTATEEEAETYKHFHLNASTSEEIDCVIRVDAVDSEAASKALDCYKTYRDTIDATGIKSYLDKPVVFEIYREDHDPPLKDLFEELPL
jgi:LmbE family N-acetylglucosaminyl deacetylase